MTSWIRPLAPALLVAATLGVALAKLPTPPPLDPAKAEEKKANDAAAAAVTAAQLAKAEDRSVAHYLNEQKAKGKAFAPQMPANGAEMDAKAKDAQAKAAAATAAAGGAPSPPPAPSATAETAAGAAAPPPRHAAHASAAGGRVRPAKAAAKR